MTVRVLLLEDNADVADTLVAAMEMRNINVLHCTYVSEALVALRAGADKFDVIVLDFDVPDGTGLDVLAMLVGEEGRRPVTVLYSGLNRDRELKAAGLVVDHQIGKEDPIALLDVIEKERERRAEG